MRVAALYDIHGNLPALEAVLPEVEAAGADLVLVGGDVASGPMPVETLARLQELGDRVRFIRGNADRVLDLEGLDDPFVQARRWVAERLEDDQLDFLAGLPVDAVLDVDGVGRVRFCHGAPGSDEEGITSLTSDERLAGLLEEVDERVVVCGHTHVQFDRRLGEVRVVNAGSVGFPWEAQPGAYWLLAGPELTFQRTAYDVDEAVRRIRATGHPQTEWAAGQLLAVDPSRPGRMSARLADG